MEKNLAQGVNQDGIRNLTFVHSHYSPNQLSDPLLHDADTRQAPLNSNGFSMHQEEILGSGYDADDSGDSPTLFSHALPEHFGPLASSVLGTMVFSLSTKTIRHALKTTILSVRDRAE